MAPVRIIATRITPGWVKRRTIALGSGEGIRRDVLLQFFRAVAKSKNYTIICLLQQFYWEENDT
jgi:hypothetical protein